MNQLKQFLENLKKTWSKKHTVVAAAVLVVLIALIVVLCVQCGKPKTPPVEEPPVSDVLDLPDEPDTPEPEPEPEPEPQDMVEDAELVEELRQKLTDAKAVNSEVFGWMYVENTNIDYPLLQADDNTKYLEKDLELNYEAHGSIFADYRNNVGALAGNFDKNTILYGHNKNDNTYFAQLAQIYRDPEVAKQSPYIYVVTEEETLVFEVFAGFYTNGSRKGMAEFNYISPNPSDEYYTKIIDGAKERSWLDYEVEVDNTDKILSLSTCSYKYISSATGQALTTQRFVVMGRLLREGEKIEEEHNITLNEDRQAPTFDEAFYDSGY